MLEFIQLLKQRYQSVITQLDHKHPKSVEYQQRIDQLLYAEAYLRKGELIEHHPDFPLQIAAIGPTQSGKSSVVNMLLNTDAAGVSPLAGYTVHAQGFCHGITPDDCDGMQHYFGRFECVESTHLRPARFDCYALSASPARSSLLPACVCWDTPDFDSIDAADYREGVIRSIALADAVILVVSKEKYADQSVWEVMRTIQPFQQPTLICVNKLTDGIETVVLDSLKQKWAQTRSDPMPQVVPVLFQKSPSIPQWPAAAARAVFDLCKRIQRQQHDARRKQWFNQYWSQWLAPVYAEHQAQRHWQLLVDQCLAQATEEYRRDYLNHPHHYETFQKALLNLLTLLEIPGLAYALGKTRRAMTWPFRKLFGLGGGHSGATANQEQAVLMQIGEHLLIQLADQVLEKAETEASDDRWWKETAGMLRQKRGETLLSYQQAVADYCSDFQQDVEVSAQRLYEKLQEQPLVLNSLRATRITTDAGAILLGIQAGGIGVHDLFITPLMLSITSLLAESAIGGYMHRVEAELKQHQLNTVKATLFGACLKQKLYPMPQLVNTPTRFNISDQQCHLAELALKEKKHGLRIL